MQSLGSPWNDLVPVQKPVPEHWLAPSLRMEMLVHGGNGLTVQQWLRSRAFAVPDSVVGGWPALH